MNLKALNLAGKLTVMGNDTVWKVGLICPLLEDLGVSDVDVCDDELVDISIHSLKKVGLDSLSARAKGRS